MSRDNTQQQINIQFEGDVSTILINAGVRAIKRNPIPVGAYVIGVMLCLLFGGFTVSNNQKLKFEEKLQTIDYDSYERAALDLDNAEHDYRRSKGWFSCDEYCQTNKKTYDSAKVRFNDIKSQTERAVSDAKAGVGIFSQFGINETRDLFWTRFTQGKRFASNQSKFDALFIGISSMGRDEGLVSYLLRVLLSTLFNFTIGMFGTVIAFIFGLYGLIQTYQVPLFYALIFFLFASLAALSFAATWLLGIYAAAAGTVYVGAKLIASNMRIEGGEGSRYSAGRVNYSSEPPSYPNINRRNYRTS